MSLILCFRFEALIVRTDKRPDNSGDECQHPARDTDKGEKNDEIPEAPL